MDRNMEGMPQDAGFSHPLATAALVVGGGTLFAAGAYFGIGLNHGGDKTPKVGEGSPEKISLTLDGTDGHGTEFAYAIAGQGSCDNYTRNDALRAANGEFTPIVNLAGGEDTDIPQFLNQHPGFAKNFAVSSFDRMSPLYTALDIKSPVETGTDAADAIHDVYANPFYVTAKLKESVFVRNTYCDNEGNLHDWHDVNLEANTFVGGLLIDHMEPNSRVAVLKNGKVMVIPDQNLIVTVLVSDGKGGYRDALMLATNKMGIDANKDGQADVGCNNVITVPPAGSVPVTPENVTTTTNGGSSTTVVVTTNTTGTTVTTGSTTTSQPQESTTIPNKIPKPPVTDPDASTTTVEQPTGTQPNHPTTSLATTTTTTAPAETSTSEATTTTNGSDGDPTSSSAPGCFPCAVMQGPETSQIAYAREIRRDSNGNLVLPLAGVLSSVVLVLSAEARKRIHKGRVTVKE